MTNRMNLQKTAIKIIKITQINKFIFTDENADDFSFTNLSNKLTTTDSNLDNSWSISTQTSRMKQAHKNTVKIWMFINYDDSTLINNELFKILQIYRSAE